MAPLSAETQKACDAIAVRAAKLAVNASAGQVKELAEAVRAVHFAPQDGEYSYTYQGEYHDHKHHHEANGERSAGFAPPQQDERIP